MNEVEKMYENARVEAKRNYYCPECESLLEDWYSGDDYIEYRCTDCEYAVDNRMEELNTLKFIDIYPPFTAEKQIEICKFLLKVEHSISYYFYENRYGFVIDDKQDGCIEAEKFETALAMIVNDLWQDLTDADKAQIKEILE